jgi:hypothetical protein
MIVQQLVHVNGRAIVHFVGLVSQSQQVERTDVWSTSRQAKPLNARVLIESAPQCRRTGIRVTANEKYFLHFGPLGEKTESP